MDSCSSTVYTCIYNVTMVGLLSSYVEMSFSNIQTMYVIRSVDNQPSVFWAQMSLELLRANCPKEIKHCQQNYSECQRHKVSLSIHTRQSQTCNNQTHWRKCAPQRMQPLPVGKKMSIAEAIVNQVLKQNKSVLCCLKRSKPTVAFKTQKCIG